MGSADIKSTLQEMDEYEFEYLVADLWELDGWDTTVSQASNDDGVDVTAIKDAPFDRKELIQAKRYSNGTSVGGPDIQQYASLRHQEPGVDSVAVVTTSGFTTSAERMAEKLNVKLVDGDSLATWIEESNENVLDEYIDQSVSPTNVSAKSVEFTQSDLARKIVDHPADLSDESLMKQELIRKAYRDEVQSFEDDRELNRVSMHFEYLGRLGLQYEFTNGQHICTYIDEQAVGKVRSIIEQEEGVELPSEKVFDDGRCITLSTKNYENTSYQGYYDVWVLNRILHEIYGVTFEDIKKFRLSGGK